MHSDVFSAHGPLSTCDQVCTASAVVKSMWLAISQELQLPAFQGVTFVLGQVGLTG